MVGRRRSASARLGGRSTAAGLTVVAVGCLIAALVAAIWFGTGWGRAQFTERPIAHARDDVSSAAEAAAVDLSSFDIGNLESSFAKIDDAVTGDLATQLAENRPMLTQVLTERGASSTASVVESGVVSLDRAAHTATVIVVMRQVTAGADGPEQVSLVTSLVSMQKVGDRWLAWDARPLGNAALDSGGN